MSRRRGQSLRGSILETIFGTLIGVGVAVVANFFIIREYNYFVSWNESFQIAIAFTFISMVRSFLVRRLFNWLGTHFFWWR